jgi:alpha-1,2-mannosyltransferase
VRHRVAVLLFAIFAIVNVANALHKGGDFEGFLQAGERLLTAQSLYEGSSPGSGVTWPPGQAVALAPFAALARIDERAARLSWYVLNLAALLAGVVLWARAIMDLRGAGWIAAWAAAPVQLSLLAILLPAPTNFEHQNMNALLLFILGAGAYGCVRGSAGLGGVWIGIAAALKAFPALLIVYLALRRQWRACAAAVAAAVTLTSAPAIWYGAAGAWRTLGDWIALAGDSGWPIREQNQSVFAMASRLAPDHAILVIAIVVTTLIGLLLWSAIGHRAVDRSAMGPELALTVGCAVLISPIAWDHYWVLMFPAFLATAVRKERAARITFWIAAILVSGLSPVTVGTRAFGWARWLSASTFAGFLLAFVQKKGPHKAGL